MCLAVLDFKTQTFNRRLKVFLCHTDSVEDQELKSWTRKHPDEWGSTEVLAWIACLKHINFNKLHLERFNCVTGRNLKDMDQHKLKQIEPTYGAQIYAAFQDLIQQSESNFIKLI